MADNNIWSDITAIGGAISICGAALWTFLKGKLQHDRDVREAKLALEREQRERENDAFERLKALIDPLHARIDHLEDRVICLEKENQILREGISKLTSQIRDMGHVPVFTFPLA